MLTYQHNVDNGQYLVYKNRISNIVNNYQKKKIMETQLKLSLTPQIIQDEKTGLFSAWFSEIPNARAIGENKEDAKVKLKDALKIIIQVRRDVIVDLIISQNMDKLTNLDTNMTPAFA